MLMLSKVKLLSAYKRGKLDTVAQQCRLYGETLSYAEWSETSGRYAGRTRVVSIRFYGIIWQITYLNGEVIEIAHDSVA